MRSLTKTFNYDQKSDFDFEVLQARQLVNAKVDTQNRDDLLYLENFGRKEEAERIILELSLCDDSFDQETEESKLYVPSCGLSKDSKVAILRVFMLHKQMNWLRSVMHYTFEEGIKNWRLPLNHYILTNSSHPWAGDHLNSEVANVFKACRRLGGPFDSSSLYQAIGGNVRLYKN